MKKKKLLVIVTIFCFVSVIVFKFNASPLEETIYLKVSDPNVNNQCYIISCSKGNLGNQIWEYMSLYVVWQHFREYGHIPYIESDMLENLKTLFSNLTITTPNHINITGICNNSRGKWTLLKNEPLSQYTHWFTRKSPCRDVFLDNYSTRYEDILAYDTKRIKKEMRFKKDLVKEAQRKLQIFAKRFAFPNKDVTFIGVHYRGSDYVDYLKVHYDINPEELPDYRYYVKAMKRFKRKYTNVIFILITIDIEWLEVNQSFIEDEGNVIVNPYEDDRLKDIVLLSQCNHSIINYGTFGVTTAFFAGGTTYVYPLKIPLDYRGATVALGITEKSRKWHVIS